MIPAAASRILLLAAALSCSAAAAGQTASANPDAILNARCAGCHQRQADGSLARIGELRKTPEGWDMSITRMRIWHGLRIEAAEQAALVKYLADRQGLAPEEVAPFRYALERRPGHREEADDQTLAEMCARCHTYARVGLQRRNAGEWLKLVHTHVGQYPTLEYQAMARDRRWWEIATTELPDRLASKWPLQTDAWKKWVARKPIDLSGRWRVAGHRPGKGGFWGTMSVRTERRDHYSVAYDLAYADGTRLTGKGRSILYTGYEWRGSSTLGSEAISEVFAVAADGASLQGRWFLDEADEIGGTLRAVRAKGTPVVLDVSPAYVRRGVSTVVTIHGVGLGSKVGLGEGVRVEKLISAQPDKVVVQLRPAPSAATGPRRLTAGPAAGVGPVVYDEVGSVVVEPAMTVARVGGAGGPVPPVAAQFEAVGYMNGPDGQPGTEDDVRIGIMPARWAVEDFDDTARQFQDAKFAGTLESTGLFRPALAGPNARRPMNGNNVGNLTVTATVADGAREVSGKGQLIVTVQRWVSPPIW